MLGDPPGVRRRRGRERGGKTIRELPVGQVRAQRQGRRQDLADAYESYLCAEALNPTEPRYPGRIAHLARRLRDDEGARAAAERALALDPDQPRALLALCDDAVSRGDFEGAEARARRVIETSTRPLFQAIGWHRIGRVRERAERWDDAFDAHVRANEIKASTPKARKAISTAIPPFEPSLNYADGYLAWGRERHDDGIPAPVVLCGFPRSGTTMVEQILASHPGIATSDEQLLLQQGNGIAATDGN